MKARRDRDSTRWLVLAAAWLASALLLFSDARAVRDYLALTGQLGLRGQAEAPTPLKQTYPEFASDAQTWVRHALALIEGPGFRLRHTDIDNAPAGREVHWNSGWAWAIAGAGAIHARVTGMPIANAVERATLWLNPLALLAIIVVFSSWTMRRMGAVAALFVAAALSLHERILEGFFPSYVDHHGLLAVSVMGTVLGALAIVDRRAPRSGAVFSALCGAFGLWVSAASVVPAIAVTGLGGAVALFVQRRELAGQAAIDAQAWRLWGRIGAGASLAFYLLEYFPQYLGWRLEVNHPLYALSWLAGGELVAQVGERLAMPPTERWRNPARLAWPLAALLAVPVAVATGGARVLSFLDPFMSRLHTGYIQEFLPMWMSMRIARDAVVIRTAVLEALPLLAAIATLALRRRERPATVWFATVAAAPLLAMAWWQTRWQLNASAAQVCLSLALVEYWSRGRAEKVRWLAAALVVAVLYVPGAIARYGATVQAVATRHVGTKDAAFALARDIAAALRASQPRGEIVLLASPNASTTVGYYGRFKTLGTLYWENAEGLKAAAAIFSARDDDEAARLVRAHGVTHVAMVSTENFVAPYYELLHPGAPPAEVEACLGWRLLTDGPAPAWLERIAYQPPPELAGLQTQVRLFRVKAGPP